MQLLAANRPFERLKSLIVVWACSCQAHASQFDPAAAAPSPANNPAMAQKTTEADYMRKCPLITWEITSEREREVSLRLLPSSLPPVLACPHALCLACPPYPLCPCPLPAAWRCVYGARHDLEHETRSAVHADARGVLVVVQSAHHLHTAARWPRVEFPGQSWHALHRHGECSVHLARPDHVDASLNLCFYM